MNHSFFFEYGEMLAKFCLCFDDTLSAHSHSEYISSLNINIAGFVNSLALRFVREKDEG